VSQVSETEAILFKPVPGGYLYQSANPWVFGPTGRYVVNEAQKAELLAIIMPRRPRLRIVLVTLFFLVIIAAATGLMWAITGHDEPTTMDILALLGLSLGGVYLALVMAVRRNLRRTRPIIAGLPRSEERITHSEIRKAMADAMSLKRSLLIAMCWTVTLASQCFTLAIRNGQHPLFGDAQSYLVAFGAFMSLGLAANYLVIALRKMRKREAVSWTGSN
jgi:hypothetical protein